MDKRITILIIALMVMTFLAVLFTALGVAELREAAGASIVPMVAFRHKRK